ncbi:MAG: hypothetical protein OEY63_02735 [Gemmatimonadota bacterium]|nr:hypothetical protein [Gemmatimonadota bacterium]MDH5804535.1 hypothetical protein [Gemmatimonadota bacterium]
MTETDSKNSVLVQLAPSALRALRKSVVDVTGEHGAAHLQQAGYSSGSELFAHYQQWICERTGIDNAEDLDASYFLPAVSEFLTEIGWGSITVSALGGAVLSIDSLRSVEAAQEQGAQAPVCHIATGVFASFFTALGGDVFAVMQVQCEAMGDPRCRFLAGSPAILQKVFEAINSGEDYEAKLASGSL